MLRHLLLIVVFVIPFQLLSQTGIGTTTPHASAKLEVAATNKGFLPPRVSLTSVTDVSTIPNPATGLLIYNTGTNVGLAAGYYYWNGNAWATIATAGGSGSFGASFLRGSRSSAQTSGLTNGGTVVFNQVDNSAGQEMSLNTSTGQITLAAGRTYRLLAQVPNFQTTSGETRLQMAWYNETSGSYIGSSSSSYPPGSGAAFGTTGGLSEALITTTTSTIISYRIIQNSNANQLGGNSDFNTIGSFPWFEAQVISGNAPVTGQSVDYVSVSTISQSAIGDNRDLIFTSNNGGNIPYNTSTGVFTLSANKTYLFQAQIRGNTPSASGSYIEYGFVDAISNALLVNGTQTITSSTTSTAGFGSNPVINFIYTPTSNQTVKLRTTATTVGTQNIASGTANITQIGSSATVNPWTLSGTNTFNTTGNVGIGTSTPSVPLDVSGAANVSGLLTAGGNSYPTTQGINGNALTTNGSGVASWNSVPPVGVVSAFAGSTAPLGYLLCDGSAVSRTTYASLFNVIGTTYGTGNGSSTFNVPDLRSRTIVGVGQGASLTNRTLASRGGIESKTLSISEIPSHGHTINDPGHRHNITTTNDDFNQSGGNPPGFAADGAGSRTWTNNITSSTTGITINNTGGSSAFEIMNPFLALNYIIKF
jgi:microcystin-dependent protein